MKNQQKTQIFLISVGVLLIILTYFYYPYINKSKFAKDDTATKNFEKTTEEEQSTTFENVEYKGFYDFDKSFIVKSEKAQILNENTDIVYMTNMKVVLYLSDGRVVNIVSDKGKYNKETYDCFFENNVRATDGETNIFAKNLDLLATENVVQIYNNVKLMYPTGSLKADKIDYNFETKNFKVSMFNDQPIKMKIIK